MTFTLHIRKAGSFSAVRTYPSYREAVFAGLELAGQRNFFVDTGAAVPARWQQLLEDEPVERFRKRLPAKLQRILDTI